VNFPLRRSDSPSVLGIFELPLFFVSFFGRSCAARGSQQDAYSQDRCMVRSSMQPPVLLLRSLLFGLCCAPRSDILGDCRRYDHCLNNCFCIFIHLKLPNKMDAYSVDTADAVDDRTTEEQDQVENEGG
jgi:hypothetical protein